MDIVARGKQPTLPGIKPGPQSNTQSPVVGKPRSTDVLLQVSHFCIHKAFFE
jgi:hypothetical protein